MLRMAPDDPDRLLEEIAEQLLAQVAAARGGAGAGWCSRLSGARVTWSVDSGSRTRREKA